MILEFLQAEEPDYNEASKLGRSALPLLDTLVRIADPLLASKATYLASLIDDENSISVLKRAAQDSHAEVRLAAAAGARNLKSQSKRIRKRNIRKTGAVTDPLNQLISTLESDQDLGVRKEAFKSRNLE